MTKKAKKEEPLQAKGMGEAGTGARSGPRPGPKAKAPAANGKGAKKS